MRHHIHWSRLSSRRNMRRDMSQHAGMHPCQAVCSSELSTSSTSCMHAAHKLHGRPPSTVQCQRLQASPGCRVELVVLACLCLSLPETADWHPARRMQRH